MSAMSIMLFAFKLPFPFLFLYFYRFSHYSDFKKPLVVAKKKININNNKESKRFVAFG